MYVKNIKACSEMSADFNGCIAIVTGANWKGKTSFLRSFIDRIRKQTPQNVVKIWEDEWYCEIQFDNGGKATRTVTKQENGEEKEKMTYTTAEGIELKEKSAVQWILQKYFGLPFDIDEFLNTSPKEQKKILQNLVWVDFTEIEEEYKQAFEERRDANAIEKQEKAKFADVEKVERVDTKLLQEKMLKIQEKNNRIETWKIYVWNAESEIERLQDEINQMEMKIKEAKEKEKAVKETLEKWKKVLQELWEKQDITEVKMQIDQAEETNKKADQYERMQSQVETWKQAQEKAKALDEKVKDIEQRKMEMMMSVPLPDGLAITDDWVTFNGFPLTKQDLSSSEIYIAALKLAYMNLPKLSDEQKDRLDMLYFDASYLDKIRLQEIENRAKTKNLQLIIERPDRDWGDITYEIHV